MDDAAGIADRAVHRELKESVGKEAGRCALSQITHPAPLTPEYDRKDFFFGRTFGCFGINSNVSSRAQARVTRGWG